MSQQIANVSLAAASVGTTGSVSWGKLLTPPTLEQQMRPGQSSAATLLIHNESGAQLLLTFPDTGRSLSFPAGKWAALHVRANEVSVTYKVTAIAPSPLFTSLLVDFYWPGEPIDPMGTLGNSPIGGPAVGVTQVIQDGQPIGQTIVESTPTGSAASTVLLTTDGKMILERDTTGNPPFYEMISGNNPLFFYYGTFDHASGDYIWFDGKAGANMIKSSNANGFQLPAAAVAQVNGQTTAGKYGVPLITTVTKDQAVSSSTAVAVCTLTTPNDGVNHFVRAGMTMWVGAGNTNAGILTAQITWTDPVFGANTIRQFNANGGSTLALISGLSTAQNGSYVCIPMEVETTANTTVQLAYQNTAAGTIADKVSGHIELLA